jgi:hypothetical protein
MPAKVMAALPKDLKPPIEAQRRRGPLSPRSELIATVERNLAKVEVASSSLVPRSKASLVVND